MSPSIERYPLGVFVIRNLLTLEEQEVITRDELYEPSKDTPERACFDGLKEKPFFYKALMHLSYSRNIFTQKSSVPEPKGS
jgi:hypothetical protein